MARSKDGGHPGGAPALALAGPIASPGKLSLDVYTSWQLNLRRAEEVMPSGVALQGASDEVVYAMTFDVEGGHRIVFVLGDELRRDVVRTLSGGIVLPG